MSAGRIKVLVLNDSPNSLSSLITSLTGSGIVSDLHILVVLMPQCCSNIQRSCLLRTDVLHFTINGCINLLMWDVIFAALHHICNASPKEDNLTCLIWFYSVVYYCKITAGPCIESV